MNLKFKKRYVLFASAILLISVFLLYEFVLQSSYGFVEYSIDTSTSKFYPDENNTIILRYNNSGKETDFYLLLSLTNASFSAQTEKPFEQVNSTFVRFPFPIRENHSLPSGSKYVFFSINENVTEFSFSLAFESMDQNQANSLASVYYLSYRWNETERCYQRWEIEGSIT
jgi:hypothetical protein